MGLDIGVPVNAPKKGDMVRFEEDIPTDGIPEDVDHLIRLLCGEADTYTIEDVDKDESTQQPYEETVLSLCDAQSVQTALRTYVTKGRDQFAATYLSDALPSSKHTTTSLHAAAAQRLLDGVNYPDEVLSLREAPSRA